MSSLKQSALKNDKLLSPEGSFYHYFLGVAHYRPVGIQTSPLQERTLPSRLLRTKRSQTCISKIFFFPSHCSLQYLGSPLLYVAGHTSASLAMARGQVMANPSQHAGERLLEWRTWDRAVGDRDTLESLQEYPPGPRTQMELHGSMFTRKLAQRASISQKGLLGMRSK